MNINNFRFNGLNYKRNNCINFYGNVNIKYSYFYGSYNCENSIIYYNGENKNSLNIFDSYFDGIYSNQCLSIRNANDIVNIKNCTFERGTSHTYGG